MQQNYAAWTPADLLKAGGQEGVGREGSGSHSVAHGSGGAMVAGGGVAAESHSVRREINIFNR